VKTRIFLAILLLGWLFPFQPASADFIEIPLYAMPGGEPWSKGTVTFDAGMPLPDIASVKLNLTGTGGGQEYIGCNAPYPWTHGVGNGELIITLREAVEEVFLARLSLGFGDGEKIEFSRTDTFPDRDFTTLETGRGQLEFENPAHMYLSGIYWICPMGHACVVETAKLVIEYGDIVPTEGTTWGALKAIYW